MKVCSSINFTNNVLNMIYLYISVALLSNCNSSTLYYTRMLYIIFQFFAHFLYILHDIRADNGHGPVNSEHNT